MKRRIKLVSTYYIKKGDRFLDRNGNQMQYGTPMRFRSFFEAWKWICKRPDHDQLRIIRVVEGKI